MLVNALIIIGLVNIIAVMGFVAWSEIRSQGPVTSRKPSKAVRGMSHGQSVFLDSIIAYTNTEE